MPRRRGQAIVSLARLICENPALLAPEANGDVTRSALLDIPGIGEWTAEYVALRALKAEDAFPATDLGLLRAMSEAGGRVSVRELRDRAECWRPRRGYAAMGLWMS